MWNEEQQQAELISLLESIKASIERGILIAQAGPLINASAAEAPFTVPEEIEVEDGQIVIEDWVIYKIRRTL